MATRTRGPQLAPHCPPAACSRYSSLQQVQRKGRRVKDAGSLLVNLNGPFSDS
jgi:hypothetical protein